MPEVEGCEDMVWFGVGGASVLVPPLVVVVVLEVLECAPPRKAAPVNDSGERPDAQAAATRRAAAL